MSITEESIGSSEIKLFQPEFSGASISFEQKGDWLHELWEYGVHIIPCGSPSDIVPQYFRKRHPFDDELELKAKWAKTPRVNWAHYQRTQPSDTEITSWHHEFPNANWAAITGINFAVIDADSEEAMNWIRAGSITRSPLTQRTPRGGEHYFYSISQHEVRTGAGKNKIDTRGVGGYVMVAPSLGYTMHCEQAFGIGSMEDLPSLTESDIQSISMFNSGGEVEPSIREKLTEEAAKEGGRNDKLARLVGKWIKEGWGMREILIKAQDWNQTCDPPLSIVETATTTLSIAQGHIKRHPEDIDAGVNEWKTSEWQTQISEDLKQIQDQEYPVEVEDAPEMGPLGLQPFSAEAWTDLKQDTVEQWWGDAFIFQNSRVLLLGKPKIGKSNFLGAFAAGATTGTDFLGVPFSKPLKVMWFQAEIIAEFMKDRITTYFRRFGDDEDTIRQGYDNLIVSGRLRKNLMTDQDIEAFHQEIQFHKPDIVMIDPIINFFDGEENSNTEIRKLLDRIDKLIELNNCAVILAHHTGKERADDKSFMSARGGSVFAGWFDSGIKMSGKKPNVSFFYEARNARDPDEHLAHFDFDLGVWTASDLTAKKTTSEDSIEDQVALAELVLKGMKAEEYYRRNELESLARQQLRRYNKPNGNKACQKAVSYVQKHLADKVFTYSEPGKAMWHYLGTNTSNKPWEV